MKVSQVMTKHVISIQPEATIVQAIKLMLNNRLSGLPVIDRRGRLVGIITEGDFLHRREISTELKRNVWLDAFFWARTKRTRLRARSWDQSCGANDAAANHCR